MQPTLDVFVVGAAEGLPSELTDPKWPFSLRVVSTGIRTLPEFPGTPWAERLLEGTGELAALVFGNNLESLQEVAQMVSGVGFTSDAAAAISVEGSDTPFDPLYGFDMGRGVRMLLAPRAGHGPVVFRRSRLKQVGPLRPVSEPIWDWLIRAVRAGEKIDSSPITFWFRSTDCRLPLLAPARPGKDADWLLEHLNSFSPTVFGLKPASKVDETALRAGLYQWHDFLDESHQLSQSIEGEGADQLGDYWHAIMHRREPDYSNAKYWFRQIGSQPLFSTLRHAADEILAKFSDPESIRWRNRLQSGSKWDPFAFVDLCEECAADESTDLAYATRRIQYIEMSLLMGITCWQCGGGNEVLGIALAAKRA